MSEPIAEYALLSDCRSAALVHREGSIDWLCFPRFDCPSVFGRLLDPDAGHFRLRPTADAQITRGYRPGTLVLETTYTTATGTAMVVDALAVGRNERGHDLGHGAPSTILRDVVVLDGEVEFELEFAPRPEYALVYPLLDTHEHGVLVRGGADRMAFSSPVMCTIDGSVARAGFVARQGEDVAFAVQHRLSSERHPVFWSVDEIRARLDDTTEGWRTWSQLHQSYDGPWRDLVQLSGRVLYALTYYPSGAICAAATTSLPEIVGGERNWDYRYAWVRDTSFTLQALWVAACPDEAGKYFDFIAGAAGMQLRRGVDLSIMFGLRGERDVTEHTLPHLRGWRDSAPVRVGNNAWMQRQLDVYGEVLDAACRLPDQVDRLSPSTRQFLRDCADTAAARWREPDRGIWEIRSEPRDFVYSKLMCWVALDRAIALADRLGATDRVAQWKDVREEIADAILRDGWSEKAGSFVQAFGSNALDASLLMMPIVGFLPANDPRVRATIDAIATRLTDERGLVYRYRTDDGLVGDESPFLLCTFHLAHALALAGEVERATQVFESAIAFANDLGLLSEEVDTNSGELLGNFPQALSHIGLVNAAWAISEAQPSSASPSS
jgi:GH15 family glucan-1,4-alpha-glucosidase